MPFQIIDNKKILLTADEITMYNNIVKSYTTVSNKGEDLFIDLFHVNDDGIIVYLKPPSKRQTSFEVFLFLMSIFQHQHLRLMRVEVDDVCTQMRDKIKEIDDKLKKI